MHFKLSSRPGRYSSAEQGSGISALIKNGRPLATGEVQVWAIDLDTMGDIQEVARLLSADECERADRFRFQLHRDRFVRVRALLRKMLGHYLGVRPEEVSFEYSRYGKPRLGPKYSSSQVKFNLSHSESMALFAFTRGRELGVDIEQIRRNLDIHEIAGRFFSHSERQALREVPPGLECEAFFACWTRKEAFVKAKGEGLSIPLEQFDVSFIPGEPAQLLATRPVAQERECWSLWDLEVAPRYASALAIEGTKVDVFLQLAFPNATADVATVVDSISLNRRELHG